MSWLPQKFIVAFRQGERQRLHVACEKYASFFGCSSFARQVAVEAIAECEAKLSDNDIPSDSVREILKKALNRIRKRKQRSRIYENQFLYVGDPEEVLVHAADAKALEGIDEVVDRPHHEAVSRAIVAIYHCVLASFNAREYELVFEACPDLAALGFDPPEPDLCLTDGAKAKAKTRVKHEFRRKARKLARQRHLQANGFDRAVHRDVDARLNGSRISPDNDGGERR